MEGINRIPQELVNIIPVFNGDTRTLPLFIKKCEYILSTFRGGAVQNEYLFHVITSRLSGEAASLVGERDSIDSWDELKKLLNQHFGDPRTEDCLAMELESCKINKGESYLDLCHRIQHMRSILFAKIAETITDDSLRKAKQVIYNNRAMNVFLFNLPPFLVRLVRLRNVSTLEDALKIVLEEQNFQAVYSARTNDYRNSNRYNKPNFSESNSTKNNSQHVSSAPAPNNASSSLPTTNNSHHIKNIRQHNNQNNFNRRINHEHNDSPSSQLSRPQISLTQQNQQPTARAPRTSSFAEQAIPPGSNSNTDVTMRTASSRRVNYINNDSYNEPNLNNEFQEHPPEESRQENFCITASIQENE